MQIDTTCPGCGRKLRVAMEHAGRTARCPLCSTIYAVPESRSHDTDRARHADQWHMQTPEGQTYGPVPREMLDQWVSEGRVSDDCRLLRNAGGEWLGAAEIYPVLRPMPRSVVPQPVFDNPVAGTPEAPPLPAEPISEMRIVNPHRGGLVLALGIVSWAIGCPIFGIMAWIMGSNDLQDMERGAMDNRGAGLTQAGQIIGMIHSVLALVVLVVGLFTALILGAFR